MYEKSPSPKPGSLRESLFIAVWRQRQEIKLLETGALILAQGDSKEAKAESSKMFNQALDLSFPREGDDVHRVDTRERLMLEDFKQFSGKVIEFTAPTAKYGNRVKSKIAHALEKRERNSKSKGNGKWHLTK